MKEIKSYRLDPNYLFVHKEKTIDTGFGMDNTDKLIGNGFGLYSSEGGHAKIGPLRSDFFRIGLCLRGHVTIQTGLEKFLHQQNTIHFTFPSQLFSVEDRSDDLLSHYILFSEKFIESILSYKTIQQQFPFFDYSGVPFFHLDEREAKEIGNLILKIDQEIKENKILLHESIQLWVYRILIEAKRSYERQNLTKTLETKGDNALIVKYKKLVNQYFLSKRQVSDYADMLNVSPNYLNKVVKKNTDKTAGQLIDEMILMEAKALLRYTDLNISEIAYQLNFNDPSHFNKFFKNTEKITPLNFRGRK